MSTINFDSVSPPAEPYDAAWKLDEDDGIEMHFSLSFSRDEGDLLHDLGEPHDACQSEDLVPFEIQSHSRHDFDDDDSVLSPEFVLSTTDDIMSTPTSEIEKPSTLSRKRRIVTPQQRRRRVSETMDQNRVVYRTMSRMIWCMQRSEATRVEIMEHFPTKEDHPVTKKRKSIQHCFVHTQTSSERLLSWMG